MGELVAGLYFGGVGGRGCYFATGATAAAEAAAVAGLNLSVIALFVLQSSFVLYPCGLVVAAVGGATSVVVQGDIFVVAVV